MIADLSANHVERHVLLCGFSVERFVHDYGFDLALYTYDANGEFENGQVFIQLKATDSPRFLEKETVISFQVASSDLATWLNEPMPVILIVYDAGADRAYWVYIQAYFESRPNFQLAKDRNTVAVHLPKVNVVDASAIRKFAQYRDDVLRQIQGNIHHHA